MPKITAPTIAAHRARTRDRIMDAVDELIRTQGIDRISMTDVANSAGITRTALYNYFPDKPALLLAFTEQVNSAFVERYRRELPSGVSAARRLSAFVRLQLEGIMAHPHPPAAELGASLGPDAYQALAAHVAPMQRLLTEILEEGTAAGEFDPLPAEPVSRLALSMVGSQRLPLVSGEIDLDETHALVTRFVLRALGVATETVDTVLPQTATKNTRSGDS
ncbi:MULTISPECIES: TetR/AcrR family transcriptional regulator [Nocardiopsis]|uniref:Transcriptional regulator, TetR family n=1 Tax=Nocardiopsis dassonvillei (strain ATCC 23218 / DSM 43111 / CIP 107115 / JCM 7437 / KCTC 9190 / NBRC 14626 / NCTC 10488 / NRRL B-5397 / IMRU 509) TaxID=446468 RepID=D7AWB9_NOCDD|nr:MULTISPECIES: TetR/AcrR family transcriptional regulator [Nocardiopsis]ADH65885.1 transcriptional regulator, TetR family [Nocardiopsis dassonvillei subsp. dassonvillei DSM 43111]APC34219.1 TetR family transcriptional regulator [Nocardiopsis dassonvillei]NKY82465.1 TetR/AcrR family transcriptional regulator [Nocardiopsis dassonvillei]